MIAEQGCCKLLLCVCVITAAAAGGLHQHPAVCGGSCLLAGAH